MVSFLLLQKHSSLYFSYNLDRMWSHYIPYRQACLAYRRQRYYLWTGFLSFLQRTVTKIYPLDCHISISYLSLWRSYMEYAPLFYTIRHFVGRAFKRSYHRYHLCFFFCVTARQKPDPFANATRRESVSATDETDNIEMDKEEEHEIDAE